MTFDESNAKITTELTGRTIDHVVRNGLELEIHCTCGHVVVLAATVDHHIVHKRTDVSVIVPGVSMMAAANSI